MKKILDIGITTIAPNLFEDEEFMKDEILNYANVIYSQLNNSTYISTKFQEKEFNALKRSISSYDSNNTEYLYWKKMD